MSSISKIIEIYSKFQGLKLVKLLNKVYSRDFVFPYEYLSIRRLKKIKNKKNNPNKKIRVFFMAMDLNTWIKLQPIYDEMQKNNNFDVSILCVANPTNSADKGPYEFFFNKGLKNCINAHQDGGRLFDLKSANPDYVFYGHPYNNYWPRQYKSNVVSSYSKILIVLYGMCTSYNLLELHPKPFNRDVYIHYAACREEIEFNKKRFKRLYKDGLQKTMYFGYPALSQIMKAKDKKSPSMAFAKNDFKLIWTPRWTTDERKGGSNFFRYKDVLIEYAENHKNIDMLFRPHPMALRNFILTGEITNEEVEAFKKICVENDNLYLDTEKEYAASFWASDLLVSDYSSIIVEYFVTGKPIIYCENAKSKQRFIEYFEKILDVSYIVHNEDELCDAIANISSGNDYKKEQRKKLIEDLFGDTLENSARYIVNSIEEDYYHA